MPAHNRYSFDTQACRGGSMKSPMKAGLVQQDLQFGAPDLLSDRAVSPQAPLMVADVVNIKHINDETTTCCRWKNALQANEAMTATSFAGAANTTSAHTLWLTATITCRDVVIDLSIQLPNCSCCARPHPHQEMLIVTDSTIDGGSSSQAG